MDISRIDIAELKALYWQINPGIPPRRYELTGRLQNQLNVMQRDLTSIKDGLQSAQETTKHMQHQQNQLNVMQRDLTSIKDGLQNVQEAIKHMQHQMTNTSHTVEEAAKYEIDERK
jgi:archaellum component FlaC